MPCVIWKFRLDPMSRTGTNGLLMYEVKMPVGAIVLSTGMQADEVGHEDIYVWAIVDDTSPVERRVFSVFATGHSVLPNDPGKFIGTVMLSGGTFVFHIFEAVVAKLEELS